MDKSLTDKIKGKEVDIYRDTPLRYLGYANELGESFRPFLKRYQVHLTYAAAISYVCCDAGDKSLKEYKHRGLLPAGIMAGDVFIWQMFASVMIPGFIINRICWASTKAVKMAKIKGAFGKWSPTIISLLSIPLIIHPIDHFCDKAMDETYRKYIKA